MGVGRISPRPAPDQPPALGYNLIYGEDYVQLGGASNAGYDIFYPRAPSLLFRPNERIVGTPTSTRWYELPEVEVRLFKRYIALTRAGLLPERPTLAQGLAASAGYFGLAASLDGRPLSETGATTLIDASPGLERVSLAIQGELPTEGFLKIGLRFGMAPTDDMTFLYAPPGLLNQAGLLFLGSDTRSSFQTLVVMQPPGHQAQAYRTPEELDHLLTPYVSPNARSGYLSLISSKLLGSTAAFSPDGVARQDYGSLRFPGAQIASSELAPKDVSILVTLLLAATWRVEPAEQKPGISVAAKASMSRSKERLSPDISSPSLSLTSRQGRRAVRVFCSSRSLRASEAGQSKPAGISRQSA